MEGVGHTPGDPGSLKMNAVMKRKKYIFMILRWGSEWFLRYQAFYAQKGVGHDPGGPKICH